MSADRSTLRLSEREREVLLRVVEGKTNKEIAAELRLSVSTVKYYVSRLCSRLGCPNRSSLTACALREGLLE